MIKTILKLVKYVITLIVFPTIKCRFILVNTTCTINLTKRNSKLKLIITL